METLINFVVTNMAIILFFTVLFVWLKWLFIRSAVQSGTEKALRKILEEKNQPSQVENFSKKTYDNTFEKELDGWISFKK